MNTFVYIWHDMKTDMYYIGSHKGTPDDGYVCSCDEMLLEYNKRPYDFKREIVHSGNDKDMRLLESTMQKTVNAASNPKYYNKHNTDGKFICKKHSEETKQKISLSKIGKQRLDMKGDNNPMRKPNKRRSMVGDKRPTMCGEQNPSKRESVKARISESMKGNKNAKREKE